MVAPADRTGYVASVLARVGTTLLLVGIVVLLERRIVDTAAKVVRRAMDAERAASDARVDRLVGDLSERLSAGSMPSPAATGWAAASIAVACPCRRAERRTS